MHLRNSAKNDHSRYELAHIRVLMYGKDGAIEMLDRYRSIAARLNHNCSEICACLERETASTIQRKCESTRRPSKVQCNERTNVRSGSHVQRSSSDIDKIVREVVASYKPAIAEAVWNHVQRFMQTKACAPRTTGRYLYSRDQTALMRFGQQEFDESKHPRAPAGRPDGGQFVRADGGASHQEASVGDDHAIADEQRDFNWLRESKAFPGYSVARGGTLIDPSTAEPVELAGIDDLYYWATGTSKVQGHHWVPREVWEICKSMVKEEATTAFDALKTDPKVIRHGFDTWKDLYEVIGGGEGGVTHHQYNQSVADLLKQYHNTLFEGRRGKLTADQATAFAQFIAEGRIPVDLNKTLKGALSSLAKTSKDSLLTVQKWRTGFYDAIGLAQHFLDKSKEAGKTLTKTEIKVLVRQVMGSNPKGWSQLSKAKQALVIDFNGEIESLTEASKARFWAQKVRGGAAKALGWSVDKLPYLGIIMAVGSHGLSGGAAQSAEGNGPYIRGVDGAAGVALNVGALLAREGVAADEVEWVFKSVIKAAGESAVVPLHPLDLRRRGAKGRLDLFQEETGLMNPVGAPPLKGKKEVPQEPSERWTGWLSIFNP